MKVAIIKYNAGNIMSMQSALANLGVETLWTDDPEEILAADKVVFPGVGEAGTTMRYLVGKKLDVLIKSLKQPVLGVCLGLQLMCSHSEEGNTTCLGIFDEKVLKFKGGLKIPHMGWNTLDMAKSPIFKEVNINQFVYFVHSFYATTGIDTAATTNYMVPFSAALQKNNFFATQFHPEKSGEVGYDILKNFLAI